MFKQEGALKISNQSKQQNFIILKQQVLENLMEFQRKNYNKILDKKLNLDLN